MLRIMLFPVVCLIFSGRDQPSPARGCKKTFVMHRS